MTIDSASQPVPAHDDQKHLQRGKQHDLSGATHQTDTAGRYDERRAVLTLASRVLGSSGHTLRLLAIVTVVLGLLIAGFLLLQVQLDLGPVRIGRH